MSVTSQPVRALPFPCTDSLTLQQPPCRLKYMGERELSLLLHPGYAMHFLLLLEMLLH